MKSSKLHDIGKIFFGKGTDAKNEMIYLEQLGTKLSSIFKDHSQQIFTLSNEAISEFVSQKFRPNCCSLFEGGDELDLFDENISSDDFINFVRQVINLQLHMVLSDPPIEMVNLPISKATDQSIKDFEKYDYWMYNKAEYYCIDGFPKDGSPCVVVLPPPYR